MPNLSIDNRLLYDYYWVGCAVTISESFQWTIMIIILLLWLWDCIFCVVFNYPSEDSSDFLWKIFNECIFFLPLDLSFYLYFGLFCPFVTLFSCSSDCPFHLPVGCCKMCLIFCSYFSCRFISLKPLQCSQPGPESLRANDGRHRPSHAGLQDNCRRPTGWGHH